MMPALLPPDEFERLNMLRGLDLLDSLPDAVLDGMVACAATVTDCPVAMLSLVDAKRQWFKAKLGTSMMQTPRDIAFCAYTILGDELFEVTDATQDMRFSDNPLVTEAPNLRFYAGMPVSVGGYRLGALCVIDSKPRELAPRERSALAKLAHTVSSWLNQHCLHLGAAESPASVLMRPWSPVEVSSNRSGGFHLALRAH